MQMASKAYGFEAFLLPEKLQRRGKRPGVAKLKKSGAFPSSPPPPGRRAAKLFAEENEQMAIKDLSDIPADRPLALEERKALFKEMQDVKAELICAESMLEVALESCKDPAKKTKIEEQPRIIRKELERFANLKLNRQNSRLSSSAMPDTVLPVNSNSSASSPASPSSGSPRTPISIVLFDGFEPLDVFGPVEVLGDLEDCELHYYSLTGGSVGCRQNCRIETSPFAEIPAHGILLIPGGMGTRPLTTDAAWLSQLSALAAQAQYVLSVCTGSALLAAAGVLDGRSATSNKRSWQWATTFGNNIDWKPRARWVHDGKFFTASGVSAGIDMALAFVRTVYGSDKAQAVARRMEYIVHPDADDDPFAVEGA